jgi:hypothetical protein
MKRDMDLIRELLLKIEESDDTPSLRDIRPSDVVEEEFLRCCEHLRLLYGEGFVTGYATLDGDWLGLKLTWPGHEFLDLGVIATEVVHLRLG